MTKHDAIIQCVPQTYNPISEALLWLVIFGACAFAAYYVFARVVLWLNSNRIKSFHPKTRKVTL